MSASTYTAVDLSRLAAPNVVETLDYEAILADVIALAQSVMGDFTIQESDPATKLLEVFAYREQVLRQRINDAAKAVMVAYATGADLDNLAALFGVTRLTLSEADADQGIEATYESDTDLRSRLVLAPEGYSVAGPEGAYVFHALSASSEVLDASASSSTPGQVDVAILPRSGVSASDDLIQTVSDYLSDETRRPLTDHVVVSAAEIVPYSITASITTFSGPDSSVVMAAAQSAIETYTTDSMRLGRNITLSGVYAALHTDGVQKVELTAPTADIPCDRNQAPVCTTPIHLTWAGTGE